MMFGNYEFGGDALLEIDCDRVCLSFCCEHRDTSACRFRLCGLFLVATNLPAPSVDVSVERVRSLAIACSHSRR
jgi:hypothetical protein